MACNSNKQQCSPENVFAAVANSNCNQFFNPGNFQAEQMIYDASFKDLINNYGIPVEYYINTFSLTGADTLYGEHPTSVFYGPVTLMMYIELTENAINLTKFGFASDDELIGYVHIQTFVNTMSSGNFFIRSSTGDFLNYSDSPSIFDNLLGNDKVAYYKYIKNGQVIEPKSGDLIQLSPLGCDRPNGRGAKIFEITERTDQDVASMNPLLGHYIYRLRAKRYENSFEPGAPQEPQNQQIFENSFSGKLSSTITEEVTSESKSYPGDVDEESKTKVFDMSVNNTDIYGSYY